MKIGIPKEIKIKENRVACTPAGARMFVQAGHEVLVETHAGLGSGFPDELFAHAGAKIVPSAADAWACDMVVKVKEPIPSEYGYLRKDLLLFTYLHLAADKPLTEALAKSGAAGVAYETVQIGRRLPLLEPMSEIAGRMSALVGAFYLSKAQGGKGVLLGGVPGVLPGNVLIIGGGTSGINAGRVAAGIGAHVTILEVDLQQMRFLDISLQGSADTLYSNEQNLMEELPDVDLLIGAVLVPGAKAPKLIRREMLRVMKPGAVFVDIAIDQGGCAETSRPTTHENPIYVEEDTVHYCVANMPGAYCRTATQALTNATIPYAVKLANLGLEEALRQVPELKPGLNTYQGHVVYKAVAEAHGMAYQEAKF
ncbi:MAG TPA: alanine dehydrogenase [Kiritimatiellia bacterium]|nr:alanine dehydrogenase [Kiritimatiellia bacterium]HMO99780.1 alanine dehydrogenase [Kiritimatiellia bacterium]HMP97246.1 alanine dehydrogenase [Kiritimatiellia bacterium]